MTGNVSVVWDLTLAGVVHVPAVLLVLATGALLFGGALRLVPATWAVLVYGFVTGVVRAVLVLLALTAAVGALGTAAFRRRYADGP